MVYRMLIECFDTCAQNISNVRCGKIYAVLISVRYLTPKCGSAYAWYVS